MKHNLTGYIKHKCRCDICKQARFKSNKQNLENLREKFKRGEYKIKNHGNSFAVAIGCRCDLCKLEMQQRRVKRSESNKEYFKKTGAFKTEKVKHGTYTAYKHYGCRCEKCRGFIASKHLEKVSGYVKKD
ncbi:hypothetical protein ACWY2P_002624 [Acinetobacter baumannii]